MSTFSSPDSCGRANQHPAVGLIAGPTASGKSDLALRLAQSLMAAGKPAVIINADSAQLYADLPILSAAPPPQDLAAVPHLLYGAWDGADSCSAADWAARARETIDTAHAQGATPILVGGTGLYMRTLLDGIAPVPPIAPAIREAVRAMPVAQAHAELSRLDLPKAAGLHPSDTTRIHRALEVVLSTGQSITHWQQALVGGIGHRITLAPFILLPDRAWLYERCNRRFGLMVEQGALEEVARLLERGLNPQLPVMRAIGVEALAAHLRGDWTLEEAMAQGAQATRTYAKRQYTWFRNQPPPEWQRFTAIPSEDFDFTSNFVSLFHD
jgi:tRNA dimethylallyltransferase